MLKKRIIPCLDIKDGRVVKGIGFKGLRDAGDPVALAQRYAEEGADELVFLDISASLEARETRTELVRQIAAAINIPFTVGGGINSTDDVRRLLEAGADKISLNSAALQRPALITEIASAFGSQCLVLAIDVKHRDGTWEVFSHGGTRESGRSALAWAQEAVELGAGEILLTSMDQDGAQSGFALDITGELAAAVSVPVIASGGAGKREDFVKLFFRTRATGALAASIFHFETIRIPELKQYLDAEGIPVRLHHDAA